ncbi:MAG: helix-turn-helix domain-containing protein [Sphingopyxis terrae]|nr:helix-turn-helix domain-containing protein [Sphingopyxis terrae]
MQDFFTVKEAAAHVGLSVHTLNAYRISGDGPPYFKLGRLVRYDRNQLEAWARSDQRQSTSEAA